MKKYIIASIHEWNILNYEKYFAADERFTLITSKKELNLEFLREVGPRYIFFPHWSWIVPKEIIENFECVCFHMTDVPFGRGGSPLQNLIMREIKETKLTALKMVEQLDAGDVYCKKSVSLEGRAEEIYMRVSSLSFELIQKIVDKEMTPLPQSGETVEFRRRTPEESDILKSKIRPEMLYDFIRMLDAPGYPHAFVNINGKKIYFHEIEKDENGCLKGTFYIKESNDE